MEDEESKIVIEDSTNLVPHSEFAFWNLAHFDGIQNEAEKRRLAKDQAYKILHDII